jgi:hypothetical protein
VVSTDADFGREAQDAHLVLGLFKTHAATEGAAIVNAASY